MVELQDVLEKTGRPKEVLELGQVLENQIQHFVSSDDMLTCLLCPYEKAFP